QPAIGTMRKVNGSRPACILAAYHARETHYLPQNPDNRVFGWYVLATRMRWRSAALPDRCGSRSPRSDEACPSRFILVPFLGILRLHSIVFSHAYPQPAVLPCCWFVVAASCFRMTGDNALLDIAPNQPFDVSRKTLNRMCMSGEVFIVAAQLEKAEAF